MSVCSIESGNFISISLDFNHSNPSFCLGNLNSFISTSECSNTCEEGGGSRAMCLLPRSPGDSYLNFLKPEGSRWSQNNVYFPKLSRLIMSEFSKTSKEVGGIRIMCLLKDLTDQVNHV